jgi:hypothetical protein
MKVIYDIKLNEKYRYYSYNFEYKNNTFNYSFYLDELNNEIFDDELICLNKKLSEKEIEKLLNYLKSNDVFDK